MQAIKNVCLFRLFIVLFLQISFNNHSTGHIVAEKFNVYTNILYQYYSNQSILGQISVQNRIQCAGQCIKNPTCKTATFDSTIHRCSLFTESINVGQLTQYNGMVTFGRESKCPSNIFERYRGKSHRLPFSTHFEGSDPAIGHNKKIDALKSDLFTYIIAKNLQFITP